jgi:AmiR/NasT family two-component response regulator
MSSRHHICIIEPDSFYGGMFARKCERRGWKTTVIEDVKHAERCLESGANIIVIDIEDPKAEMLVDDLRKKGSKHTSVPIVILTKHHDRNTIDRMMKAGVEAYLIKGHFVPHEAVEKLHRILDSRMV